jgi:hypothetical protein
MSAIRISTLSNRGRYQHKESVAAGESKVLILQDSYKSCVIDIVPTGTTFMLATTAAPIDDIDAEVATFFDAYTEAQSAAVEEALENGIVAIKVSNTGSGSLVVCISGD